MSKSKTICIVRTIADNSWDELNSDNILATFTHLAIHHNQDYYSHPGNTIPFMEKDNNLMYHLAFKRTPTIYEQKKVYYNEYEKEKYILWLHIATVSSDPEKDKKILSEFTNKLKEYLNKFKIHDLTVRIDSGYDYTDDK